MRTRSEIQAGAVILAALVLGGVILGAAGHWRELFRKKQTLRVLFTDVQGLQAGDPVQVMGLQLGKVTGIEITRFKDGAGLRAAVEVTARMAYPEAFPRDTRVAVDRTLTGNTVLTVEPGRAEARLAAGERVLGAEPVSMRELSARAGSIARRLDDFVGVVADKKMSGAALAAAANLRETSELARSVMASLNRSIPAAERGIVNSVNNLERFSGTVAGSGPRLADTAVNLRSASASLARAGENFDAILTKSREPLINAFSNADTASANLKSLTRQVRWQPWLLLKKPGKAEEYKRGMYNAALDFCEGANTLHNSVADLSTFVKASEAGGVAGVDAGKFELLVQQAHDNLKRSEALERKLWQDLNGEEAKTD